MSLLVLYPACCENEIISQHHCASLAVTQHRYQCELRMEQLIKSTFLMRGKNEESAEDNKVQWPIDEDRRERKVFIW